MINNCHRISFLILAIVSGSVHAARSHKTAPIATRAWTGGGPENPAMERFFNLELGNPSSVKQTVTATVQVLPNSLASTCAGATFKMTRGTFNYGAAAWATLSAITASNNTITLGPSTIPPGGSWSDGVSVAFSSGGCQVSLSAVITVSIVEDRGAVSASLNIGHGYYDTLGIDVAAGQIVNSDFLVLLNGGKFF